MDTGDPRLTCHVVQSSFYIHMQSLRAGSASRLRIASLQPKKVPSVSLRLRASAAASQSSTEAQIEGSRVAQVEGISSCTACGGLGKLPRGGFHKKNPLNPAKLLSGSFNCP